MLESTPATVVESPPAVAESRLALVEEFRR
jgi:hypothetical protein